MCCLLLLLLLNSKQYKILKMSGFWDDISIPDEQSSSQYSTGGAGEQQEQDWPDERSEVSGFSQAYSQLNDESTAPDDFDVRVGDA
jgi:hypothetical protein